MKPTDSIDCTKCQGKGETHSTCAHYDAATGVFSPGMRPCHYCSGRGTFPGLDLDALLGAIVTTRGRKRFRRAFPSPDRKDTAAARAYFVWRMARFHGGADVTMPMTAMGLVEGDSLAKVLDVIADRVAVRVFGTAHAAASRWGRALGYPVADVAGMPASAYEGGPVHDGNDDETIAMLAATERAL